jgi:hypothetical protein
MESQVKDVAVLPPVEEHVAFGIEVLEGVKSLDVKTAEDMEVASGIRQKIKDRTKAVKGLLEPFIKAAHALHKSHTARRKDILAPLEKAEEIINGKMVDWQIKEEKRLAEEQKKRDEEEKLAAAIKAEEEGNESLSEAIMDDQVPVTAAPVEKTKTEGVSFTETYDYEIVAESKLPREYLMPNDKAIKAVVKAQKDKTNIPGVRVFAKKGIKSKPSGMSNRSW